jgi:hypothetical protein
MQTTKHDTRSTDTAFSKLAKRAPNLTGYSILGLISFSLLALLIFIGIAIRRGCLVALLGIGLLLGLAEARAQTPATTSTNPPATAPATFVDSLKTYFGSFDTNSTTFKKANEIDVMVSADTQSGVTSAGLGLSYNLWSFVSVEEVTRNAGIGGTICGQIPGSRIRVRRFTHVKFANLHAVNSQP